MKFQIVLAAIFAFAAVSTRDYFRGNTNAQILDINNYARSNGEAIAINQGIYGRANAYVNSRATNYNDVQQNQNNY